MQEQDKHKRIAKAEDIIYSDANADNEDKQAKQRMKQADQRVELGQNP